MYEIIPTNKFKKDLKRIKKRSPDGFQLLSDFLIILQNKGAKGIPTKMRPHKLKGHYTDNWECHLKPDLLVIWIQREKEKTIHLVRIGSHSDLF